MNTALLIMVIPVVLMFLMTIVNGYCVCHKNETSVDRLAHPHLRGLQYDCIALFVNTASRVPRNLKSCCCKTSLQYKVCNFMSVFYIIFLFSYQYVVKLILYYSRCIMVSKTFNSIFNINRLLNVNFVNIFNPYKYLKKQYRNYLVLMTRRKNKKSI